MKTRIYVSNKIKKVHRGLDLKSLPEKEDMLAHNNSWNANYLSYDGKKCWVLSHSKTRYTVVLPDLTAKKLKDLRWFFLDQIVNQYLKGFGMDRFEAQVDPYHFNSFFGDFEFYPTNNDKSCIGYVNQKIVALDWHKYVGRPFEDIPFYRFGAGLNKLGTMKREGKSVNIYPDKEMLAHIKQFHML